MNVVELCAGVCDHLIYKDSSWARLGDSPQLLRMLNFDLFQLSLCPFLDTR